MDRNDSHEPKVVKQLSLAQFETMFPDEASCKNYLVQQRWPNGVTCPRCGNEKVYEAGGKKPWHWSCHKCGGKTGYRFSLYVGTIYENTNYPLRTWFKVLYLMLVSKKGISAMQIHRMIDSGSYKTAWFMCHRLRAGLANPEFRKLMGIVEVDETFIGGKEKNKHANKRTVRAGTGGKTPVIGAIARKGNVVCQMVEHVDTPTLTRFVRQAISDKVELVATDEAAGYNMLPFFGYRHESVKHRAGEYVRGEVHTANLDSFWSLLKRGIIGTYHSVSKKYLPLYLNEFQFRHNNRKNPDIFRSAIAGC